MALDLLLNPVHRTLSWSRDLKSISGFLVHAARTQMSGVSSSFCCGRGLRVLCLRMIPVSLRRNDLLVHYLVQNHIHLGFFALPCQSMLELLLPVMLTIPATVATPDHPSRRTSLAKYKFRADVAVCVLGLLPNVGLLNKANQALYFFTDPNTLNSPCTVQLISRDMQNGSTLQQKD